MHGSIIFIILSFTGSLVAMIGILVSALTYKGKNGEAFSPLNHFISELGEVGVSKLAWAFNIGLILSGLCLIPPCIALGLIIPGFISRVGVVAGVVSAVGLILVGIYPMNNLEAHSKAALTFFTWEFINGFVLFFGNSFPAKRFPCFTTWKQPGWVTSGYFLWELSALDAPFKKKS